MTRVFTMVAMAGLSVVAACARASIPPAIVGAGAREIDAPCDPTNGTLAAPMRRIDFDPLEFNVPTRWIPNYRTINDIDFNLQRTGAELHVWKGGEFIFNPVIPINSAACEIVRGDTTIKVRTTVFVQGIRQYRVDISWSPLVGGQHVYMQLATRFPEHLKEIRGVIESVRMPVRTATDR
ncbi:MAG: hypothetical protein H7099_20380 [Gemmatimonadaceae bacterium]|nr:hypothetical protein [Gemmatimonadaceae bacterium]